MFADNKATRSPGQTEFGLCLLRLTKRLLLEILPFVVGTSGTGIRVSELI